VNVENMIFEFLNVKYDSGGMTWIGDWHST